MCILNSHNKTYLVILKSGQEAEMCWTMKQGLKLQPRYPEPNFLRCGFENSLKCIFKNNFMLRATLNRKYKEFLCAFCPRTAFPTTDTSPLWHSLYSGCACTMDMWTLRQSHSFHQGSSLGFKVTYLSSTMVPYRIYRMLSACSTAMCTLPTPFPLPPGPH